MHKLLILLSVSACTGIVDGSTGVSAPDAAAGGGGNPDAHGGGGSDAATPLPDGASGLLCKNQVLTGLGSGHHNAGLDCLNGCHNHGFTLAGTIYSTATGGAALTGATVTVKDASGTTFDVISQLDGNFYTTQPVTFPLTVYASSCPSVQPMVATVAAGGCNKVGCHTSNAQGQIHLP
jgi:hypothetical protein